MTADEIIVGIDDSPSARAAHRWAAVHARSTGSALRTLGVVEWPEAQEMYVYPIVAQSSGHPDPPVQRRPVADYVYPDGPGRSAAVRQ